MTTDQINSGERVEAVEIERFDFSTLVGHKITLYAEQFPGKPLTSRVTVANGKSIALDRSGGSGLIDNLVNNQKVILQVQYKGEPVSIDAFLKRTDGGACRIHLGDRVTPMLRRRFYRVPISCPFRLAAIPVARVSELVLSQLRWMETETVNLSGGGAMISFSSLLESPTYLFVNIDLPDLGFPSLILGQVRHSLVVETGRWNIGVQFLTSELRREHLPFHAFRRMPASALAFDAASQAAIEQKLIAWMQETNSR